MNGDADATNDDDNVDHDLYLLCRMDDTCKMKQILQTPKSSETWCTQERKIHYRSESQC